MSFGLLALGAFTFFPSYFTPGLIRLLLGRRLLLGLIREKIINQLLKAKEVNVTERREKADAVLKGVATLTSSQSSSLSGNGDRISAQSNVSWDATIAVRLVSRDGDILWADDSKPSVFSFGRSQSSSAAGGIVKKLVKSIRKARKSRR